VVRSVDVRGRRSVMRAGGGRAWREGRAMGHQRDHEWLETFEGDGADRYAQHARWMGRMHERTAHRVAEALPHGGSYVDVGTGPGTLPAQVAALRPDAGVTGVDPSQRMVELATAHLAAATVAGTGGRVVLGDAAHLPLPDASAEVVSAVLTMHHWPDLDGGIAELIRVLAPGGTVLVVEMRGPSRHVARALRRAGLLVVRQNAWVMGLPVLVRLSARRPG
jgi:ubiquinone/menaquinone biosynthesis C-methylase UbiE